MRGSRARVRRHEAAFAWLLVPAYLLSIVSDKIVPAASEWSGYAAIPAARVGHRTKSAQGVAEGQTHSAAERPQTDRLIDRVELKIHFHGWLDCPDCGELGNYAGLGSRRGMPSVSCRFRFGGHQNACLRRR
jgi:hypothetical protein